MHINYDDYDGHRHVVKVVENTPLHHWFKDYLVENGKMEIFVNSYHHQGGKRLAQRFVPMAFAPDGLIEGFYDPDAYNPEEGKFIMGLQFHPERMRKPDCDEFDYQGCPFAYKLEQSFLRVRVQQVKSFLGGLLTDLDSKCKKLSFIEGIEEAKRNGNLLNVEVTSESVYLSSDSNKRRKLLCDKEKYAGRVDTGCGWNMKSMVKMGEELKANEEALALVEVERCSKEAAEANNRRNLKALRLKIEIEIQRRKDDLLRLEQELACLKVSAQSADLRRKTNTSLTSESEGAKLQREKIAQLFQELYNNIEGLSDTEISGDRECIGKFSCAC
ncbi:hypothetical protein RIF29_25580 [Crotalaria pallida]|uniref:Uncharacterized protein n=1 Tax=Crotalaria pallida TaxID=3830 RepID=A0AAN9I4C4_CROPI